MRNPKPETLNPKRSYGIFHQYTAPQLLPDDHPLLKAAAWTKYNIAVRKPRNPNPKRKTLMWCHLKLLKAAAWTKYNIAVRRP